MHMASRNNQSEFVWCAFGVLVAIFMRLCTTLHPYSGAGKPPMFGDYEAQRHWMEITVNLPINQWYHNSTQNNLEYWGLDYPPLTAYHSYVCGLVAYVINPQYVELVASRGFESEQHKLFMRYTVIVADLCVYIPAVILFFIVYGKQHEDSQMDKVPLRCKLVLSLLYPGLILIDHGHFQYNCISLGLLILAVTALTARHEVSAAILFSLALNYKQMELYHAFPFFLYMLSCCIPKPGENAWHGIIRLTKISLAVLITFGCLWLPFTFHVNDILQVLHRLFPLARGIFEDKVANVWCTLNVFYKLKSICHVQLVRYCTVATLTAILPSSSDLFLRPSIDKFIPALINSSLGFFLFSYQVHEKSILLAAIPALLYLPRAPLVTFWFLCVTNFSMLPLFIKDGLVIAYLSLTVFYIVAFASCQERWNCDEQSIEKISSCFNLRKLIADQPANATIADVASHLYQHLSANRMALQRALVLLLITLSFIGAGILTLLILVFDPPTKYPDLFTFAISTYACLHFVAFFVYYNVVQFKIPQSFDDVHIKLKQS